MKKLQMAMAISLILGAQCVVADVNIEQAQGIANFDNIQNLATNPTTINIAQASRGNGNVDLGSAAWLLTQPQPQTNYYNTNQISLLANGANGTAVVNLGQGYHYNSGFSQSGAIGTNRDLIYGTITEGAANISQNTDENTVKLNLKQNGTGLVTVNQGQDNASGGKGFIADITQSGSGIITVNQGRSATTAISGTATANNSGTGDIVITQDSTVAGDAGTISATNSGAGIINSNTDTFGVSAGSLTITNTNSGNVYVNRSGSSSDTAAAAVLQGTATLSNKGAGDIGLKQVAVGGVVNAYTDITSSGSLLIDNGGTSNTVNVGTSSTDAIISGGTLTLVQATGTSNNLINVKGFSGGTLEIAQNAGAHDSSVNLTVSTGFSSNSTHAIVNQTGSYQGAILTTNNGSGGTFNLNASGVSGTNANVNLTL